jgi:hypothetical protein
METERSAQPEALATQELRKLRSHRDKLQDRYNRFDWLGDLNPEEKNIRYGFRSSQDTRTCANLDSNELKEAKFRYCIKNSVYKDTANQEQAKRVSDYTPQFFRAAGAQRGVPLECDAWQPSSFLCRQ